MYESLPLNICTDIELPASSPDSMACFICAVKFCVAAMNVGSLPISVGAGKAGPRIGQASGLAATYAPRESNDNKQKEYIIKLQMFPDVFQMEYSTQTHKEGPSRVLIR